jgi:hypothetical protein
MRSMTVFSKTIRKRNRNNMDFIVMKTTNETYGVSGVDTPQQAIEAHRKGVSTPIGHTETVSTQPRQQLTPQPSLIASIGKSVAK